MEGWSETAGRTRESLKRLMAAYKKAAQVVATYHKTSDGRKLSLGLLRSAKKARKQAKFYDNAQKKLIKVHKKRVQEKLLEAQNLWLRKGVDAEEEVLIKIQRLEEFQQREQTKFLIQSNLRLTMLLVSSKCILNLRLLLI